MSEIPTVRRALIITFFPMFIATLSLVTSIYNGYLNSKFVDIIQNNIGRVEYMRTCKEVIDAYFQIKFRAGVLNRSSGSDAGSTIGPARIEAGLAVAKFGALGTYLVNLRDETIRERYTLLTQQLDRAVIDAQGKPAVEFKAQLDQLDRAFAVMNDDCVTFAKTAPM
jgi:hypothetical protein